MLCYNKEASLFYPHFKNITYVFERIIMDGMFCLKIHFQTVQISRFSFIFLDVCIQSKIKDVENPFPIKARLFLFPPY